MSNIFRQEKTKRLVGDDLVRSQTITSEFWEAEAGGQAITGTGAFSQLAATIAGQGIESFVASGAVTQTRPTITAQGIESFIGAGALAQPAPALDGSGMVGTSAITGDGEIVQPLGAMYGEGNATVAGTPISMNTGARSRRGRRVTWEHREVWIPIPVTGSGEMVQAAARIQGEGVHDILPLSRKLVEIEVDKQRTALIVRAQMRAELERELLELIILDAA